METNYKIKIGDSFSFSISKEKLEAIDFLQTENEFHVLDSHKAYQTKVLDSNFNDRKYVVKINSNAYHVQIQDDLDLLIEKMGLSLGNTSVINEINAPMPGLILSVEIKEGDPVKEGDYLMVLEAMKMENSLVAPRDGVVKSILIEKGQTVNKNQLLIELE